MDPLDFIKIAPQKLSEIRALLHLEPHADELLDDTASTVACLESLLAARDYRDAVRLLAGILPCREAVWWACVCIRSAPGSGLTGEAMRVLMAVESWVHTPSENNRARIRRELNMTGAGGPVSFAAAAAVCSNAVSRYPGGGWRTIDEVRALSVSGAVMLAVEAAQTDQREACYQDCIDRGIRIAKGESGR